MCRSFYQMKPNTPQQIFPSPTIQSFVEFSYKPKDSDPAKKLVVAFLTEICSFVAVRIEKILKKIWSTRVWVGTDFMLSRKIIENYKCDIEKDKCDIEKDKYSEELHKSLRNILPASPPPISLPRWKFKVGSGKFALDAYNV